MPSRTIAALAFVALAGCTGSSNYFIPYKPAKGTASEGAHRTALLAITDMGKTVETNDPDNGIVLTEWEDGRAYGQMRIRFRVSVADGRYDVAAMCEQFIDGPGNDQWTKCDPAKRPRWVVEEMTTIAEALE